MPCCTHCCAVSPEGVAGTSSCHRLWCLPLAGASPACRRGLFMLHPSQVCRNTFAWYSLRCSKGSFIAWSALLLLCWWLWVLLCGRELFLHPLLTEDSEPSPPQATQQVTLKQRWILWTLWIKSVPTGWRQGWCKFIFSLDEVVSVVVWRWAEDRQE